MFLGNLGEVALLAGGGGAVEDVGQSHFQGDGHVAGEGLAEDGVEGEFAVGQELFAGKVGKCAGGRAGEEDEGDQGKYDERGKDDPELSVIHRGYDAGKQRRCHAEMKH